MEVQFSDGTREYFEDAPLASGGQGAVFRSVDQTHVVKLYSTAPAPQQTKERLDMIIDKYNVVRDDSYWNQLFAWPDKRAVSPRIGVRMRYVADLTTIDNYFFPPAYLRLAPEQRGWWIGRVASAIKLVRAVGHMARAGLCHGDLSEKNLMVDPCDGRLTVIDCDSIVVPDEMPATVFGTDGYMAPELVSRTAAPSVFTDRHSLAVLLYRWLLFRHPLKGPKFHSSDPQIDEELSLGERALYIEHPTDRSNRPSNLMMTADKLTPRLNDLFVEAFITHLHDIPKQRPTPDHWERALLEMLDRILPCANPRCELKYFPAPDAGALRCPLCKTYADFPARLPFLKLRRPQEDHSAISYVDDKHPHYIVGWPERPLYRWHAYLNASPNPDINANSAVPDTSPQALIRFDANTQEWYLENLHLHDLAASPNGADWTPILPSARVLLAHNTELQLGPRHTARRAIVEMRRVQFV